MACSLVVLLGRSDEDRTLCSAHDSRSHAADENTIHEPLFMAAKRDQVAALAARVVENRFRRLALEHHTFDLAVRPTTNLRHGGVELGARSSPIEVDEITLVGVDALEGARVHE